MLPKKDWLTMFCNGSCFGDFFGMALNLVGFVDAMDR